MMKIMMMMIVIMICKQFLQDYLDKQRRGKPDLNVDQDQHYKITLKTEGKADRTGRCIFIRGCEVF